MFAHHRRKIQLLFALADAVLTILAFELAYITRVHMTLDLRFFLRLEPHILLVSFSAVVWIVLGSFHRVYEYLDSANPRRLLLHTFRQSVFGILLVIIFQYLCGSTRH